MHIFNNLPYKENDINPGGGCFGNLIFMVFFLFCFFFVFACFCFVLFCFSVFFFLQNFKLRPFSDWTTHEAP